MPSNRLYDQQLCINPFCDQLYCPHDKRQVFHNAQCRTNYYNDKNRFFSLLNNDDSRDIEFNIWLLEAFLKNVNYNGKVKEAVLIEMNFTFSKGEWSINTHTNRPVKCFSNYGLEMIDIKERAFEIHKLENLQL